MEHFYITGDTHRNQYKWVEQIEPILSPADKILVCGDFGVQYGVVVAVILDVVVVGNF